jgi:type VI protein secretion system component VasF
MYMRTYKKEIRIFLAIWAVFLLCIMVCLSAFTLHKIQNDTKLNNAQINQIGKPVVIEQNYHTTLSK